MAYVPNYTITNAVLRLIVRTEVAKEVITNSPLVPYWERQFQSQAIVRTVHHSTALEGNKLTEDQAKDVIKGEILPTARIRDVKEIVNYRKAIGIVSGIEDIALTMGFVLNVHKILGLGILPDKYLGCFRRRNAVILSSSTGEVVFDPPPPDEIEPEMQDLIDWENNQTDNLNPLIKAGILHFELVRIHPFADLNGRTARLIATWSLYRDKFDINKYFSLEEYYDQNPAGYYNALDSANDGDLTNWLEYFIQGMAEEMEIVKNKVIEISKDRRFKTKVGQVALNERQIKIIQVIEENSEFTNPDFSQYFPHVSDDSILRDLKDLIDKKVIIKKGKTKGAKYIMA